MDRIELNTNIIFIQGHDTTTSGITFCLYNIAKHPEVQEKCFKEIRTVFGNDKTAPTTLSQLNDLHYLEMVIKETLRLFPSVPFIGRFALEDIELCKYPNLIHEYVLTSGGSGTFMGQFSLLS